MIQKITECKSCGVDVSQMERKNITWEFTESVDFEVSDEQKDGNAFVCTNCGCVHSINQPLLSN